MKRAPRRSPPAATRTPSRGPLPTHRRGGGGGERQRGRAPRAPHQGPPRQESLGREGRPPRGCHAVSRQKQIKPGGCAVGKPTPRTRTKTYTPSQGLGGCHAVSRQEKSYPGAAQSASRLPRPGRVIKSPRRRKEKQHKQNFKFRPGLLPKPAQNSGARYGEHRHQNKLGGTTITKTTVSENKN